MAAALLLAIPVMVGLGVGGYLFFRDEEEAKAAPGKKKSGGAETGKVRPDGTLDLDLPLPGGGVVHAHTSPAIATAMLQAVASGSTKKMRDLAAKLDKQGRHDEAKVMRQIALQVETYHATGKAEPSPKAHSEQPQAATGPDPALLARIKSAAESFDPKKMHAVADECRRQKPPLNAQANALDVAAGILEAAKQGEPTPPLPTADHVATHDTEQKTDRERVAAALAKSLAGVAKGKEDKGLVQAYQRLAGLDDGKQMYGPATAHALADDGIVPPSPLYWSNPWAVGNQQIKDWKSFASGKAALETDPGRAQAWRESAAGARFENKSAYGGVNIQQAAALLMQ